MTNPEKAQLIHPPIKIMGRTLVTFPFNMSVNMLESATRTHAHTHTQNIDFSHFLQSLTSRYIPHWHMFILSTLTWKQLTTTQTLNNVQPGTNRFNSMLSTKRQFTTKIIAWSLTTYKEPVWAELLIAIQLVIKLRQNQHFNKSNSVEEKVPFRRQKPQTDVGSRWVDPSAWVTLRVLKNSYLQKLGVWSETGPVTLVNVGY